MLISLVPSLYANANCIRYIGGDKDDTFTLSYQTPIDEVTLETLTRSITSKLPLIDQHTIDMLKVQPIEKVILQYARELASVFGDLTPQQQIDIKEKIARHQVKTFNENYLFLCYLIVNAMFNSL